MIKPRSFIRHQDRYKCLKLCQQKESEGYECIRPMIKKSKQHKMFALNSKNRPGYRGSDYDFYWEAVYERRA